MEIFVAIAYMYIKNVAKYRRNRTYLPAVVCFKCGFLDLTVFLLRFLLPLLDVFSSSLLLPLLVGLVNVDSISTSYRNFSLDTHLRLFRMAGLFDFDEKERAAHTLLANKIHAFSSPNALSQYAIDICTDFHTHLNASREKRKSTATGDKVRKRL